METISYIVQNEEASTSRPSFFYGNDYVYWKVMMSIYLQSIDYDISPSIKNELHKLTKIENDMLARD
jgi:hypothetical protein